MESGSTKVCEKERNLRQEWWKNVIVLPIVLWGLLAFWSSVAMAQTGFSGLRGNVTDDSNGVVAGVQVVLTEPATGIRVRMAVSDAQGNYEFPNLVPGTYQVQSEMGGYRDFIAKDVVLDPGQIRRLDIRLAVGGTSQTVEVVEGQAVINTEGGTISSDFNLGKKADVPVIDSYPSPYSLFLTLPAVQGYGDWDMKVSGLDSSQRSMQFDGVANDRSGDQSNNMHFFENATVVSVNAPADSSRAVAFDLSSKRGQNEFHGMVYYQHYNGALNATMHPQPQKIPYVEHDWQGELSGPIWRNHTFFYGSWFEEIIPLGSYAIATVPTQAMWNGDFSAFPTIIDPQTGKPFPNNKIPANRISSVASAVKQYYPLPDLGDPNIFNSNNYG